MKTKLLLLSAVAIALSGCGGDSTKFISGNINDPASVSIDGTPEVGQELEADVADGNRFDSGSVIYTWLSDGTPIDGASGDSFTVTADQAGTTITVSARFIDNNNFPENTTSEGVDIPEIAVNEAATVSISGDPLVGQVLTATVADSNGFDAASVVYAWSADDTVIAGATANTFTLTDAQAGTAVTVAATFTDTDGFAEDVTSAAVNVTAPAVNQAASVAVTGSAVEGQVLTATVTDGNGFDAASVVYAWSAGSDVIAGATASTFTLTAAQVGSAITASASFDDNDGFTESVTSTATAAVTEFNRAGTVAITGDTTSGSTLTATVTDDNGATGTITYAWAADGTAIAGATAMTYVLTAAENGTVVSVTATYEDDAGFDESVSANVTVPVPAPSNVAATFESLEATTFNDVATGLSGTVVVTDPDTGEAGTVAQTGVTTTYGTFSIDTAGEWTYSLDTANATIAALADSSASVVDTIAIDSIDGTAENIEITIIGNDDSVVNSRVAVIRDTTAGDTGELRYTLPTALAAGRLEVKFTREDDALGSTDAFISLFNENNNNAGAIIDLRITDEAFRIRAPDTTIATSVAAPSMGSTLQQAVITWEYPGGDTTQQPQVTVSIDGVDLMGGPFTATSDPDGGVTTVSFRIGANDDVFPATATFTVDDIAVFDDTAGASVVFVDSFETKADGTDLDPDADSTSVYASNTSEAVVEAVAAAPTGGPGTAGNQIALVTDMSTGDTGELRYRATNSILVGRMTFSINRQADTDDRDAQVAIFGTSTSTSDNIIDLRLDQSGGDFEIRDISSADVAITNAFTTDQWYDVEIAWDGTNTDVDNNVNPMVTLTIDGVVANGGAAFMSSSGGTQAEIGDGAQRFQFRIAGGSDTTSTGVLIDNITIYSSDSGSEVQVFTDDFESYTVGESLDPNAVTGGDVAIPGAIVADPTPYDNNSFSVVVDDE